MFTQHPQSSSRTWKEQYLIAVPHWCEEWTAQSVPFLSAAMPQTSTARIAEEWECIRADSCDAFPAWEPSSENRCSVQGKWIYGTPDFSSAFSTYYSTIWFWHHDRQDVKASLQWEVISLCISWPVCPLSSVWQLRLHFCGLFLWFPFCLTSTHAMSHPHSQLLVLDLDGPWMPTIWSN